MRGNSHVPFLGEDVVAIPRPYPTNRWKGETSVLHVKPLANIVEANITLEVRRVGIDQIAPQEQKVEGK